MLSLFGQKSRPAASNGQGLEVLSQQELGETCLETRWTQREGVTQLVVA